MKTLPEPTGFIWFPASADRRRLSGNRQRYNLRPQGSGEPANVMDAEMLNRGLPPSVMVKADGAVKLEINTETSVSRGIRAPRVLRACRYVEMCVLSKA